MPQFRLLLAGNLAELQSSILNFHLSLEKAVSHLQMKRKNIFLPGDEFLQLLSFCFYRQFKRWQFSFQCRWLQIPCGAFWQKMILCKIDECLPILNN